MGSAPTHSQPFVAIRTLALLGIISAALFVFYLSIGATSIPIGKVLHVLLTGDWESSEGTIMFRIRLPRACGCLAAGAILAMVGSAFQALFRNPLAEPYVVGVSSGAAVGGALAVVTGFGAGWTGLALGLGTLTLATVGGMAALLSVLALSRRRSVLEVHTLLLSGVVLGAMLSAVLSMILLMGGRDANQVLRWLLGSFAGISWPRVAVMAIAAAGGGILLLRQSKRLNAFSLGEETAQRLGVDVRRLKPTVLVLGTVMTAVTVGSVGIIGFLGLVAPHISRRWVGVDWRWSLAASALIGSSLLLAADLLAQRAIANTEIPVGVVTAILGAPVLITLMRRRDAGSVV
jgi:iron complex transport system permease protein